VPWCPNYQPCPRHPVIPFAGSAPMPPDWPALRAACLARDGYRCRDCGAPATDADHIVPRSAGGPNTLGNLAARCGPCHRRRTGRMHGR
jgi:5-methylcytosine-specific restriction endonuclease McrA